MTPLTKYEMETVINFNDAEDIAYISTSQSSWKTKIKELAETHPDDVKITREDEFILFAQCPKKYVKLMAPRTLSEEQKQANIERLKKYQFKKK